MDRTKRLTLLRMRAQDKIFSTTLHATCITKLLVPFCSVQDGDESAEYELFSVLSEMAKFQQNNKSKSNKRNEQLRVCRNDNG